MKQVKFILLIILGSLLFYVVSQTESIKITEQAQPVETIVRYDMEDGIHRDLKKEWLEAIHKSAPDVSWESIEHQNVLDRLKLSKEQSTLRVGEEIIADGALVGEWFEIGSKNQAGSVFATTYDSELDELYLISAGGILFKGNIEGSNWQSQNDLVRFDPRFLSSTKEDSIVVLATAIKGMPHYSTDKGVFWQRATGFNDESEIAITSWVKTTENNEIFILRKTSHWSDFRLYVSLDSGRSYERIFDFQTSDLDNLALCNPNHTEEFYLMEQIAGNVSRLYRWNRSNQIMEALNGNTELAWGGDGRGNLIGTVDDQDTVLYSYKKDNTFWQSNDFGETWNSIGQLPADPWRVGVYVSKENPKLMFMGEVEGFRSDDGGLSWERIHKWWEYYQDVEGSLHADIMFFSEYKDEDDQNFLLISNHGGISKSYDGGITFENIGLQNLNVSQYYDVRSHPLDPNFVFAGSQDQGFQRGLVSNNEPSDFDQVISGDYGHITFTNNGGSFWMVYPGGDISYYENSFGGISNSWVVDSEDESVWIPPIVAHPDPTQNMVYLAGGNMSGGPGSYLIRLLATPSNDIVADQFSYDFLQDGKGEISAIEFNKFDPEIVYVASTNGGFWVSNDGGENFQEKNVSVPNAQYLYGSDILASSIDSLTVYISGSGYSNAPVIVSYDGGETFQDMNQGLPPTVAFEIVTNAEETLMFTATEAGPYVYIMELEEWFYMGGVSAPNQTYWSVEYIEEVNKVRFGTYGRGIWDFDISEEMVSSIIQDNDVFQFEVFPNPFVNEINVRTSSVGKFEVKLFDLRGQMLLSQSGTGELSLDLSNFPDGSYVLNGVIDGKQKSKTVIKQGQ